MLPPQQLELFFHLLAAHLGVPDRGLNGRHPAFRDMPQIIGHLFQAPTSLACSVRKIVTQIVEIEVVDEPGFCKARPCFELLPPLVDAILRPAPSVDLFRTHVLFRTLARKDVGARFAFTLLEVVIQWAACLIRPLSMVRSLPPLCPTVIHPALRDTCV